MVMTNKCTRMKQNFRKFSFCLKCLLPQLEDKILSAKKPSFRNSLDLIDL